MSFFSRILAWFSRRVTSPSVQTTHQATLPLPTPRVSVGEPDAAPPRAIPVLTTKAMNVTNSETGVSTGPSYGDYGARQDGQRFSSHAERREYERQVMAAQIGTRPYEDQSRFVSTTEWTPGNWMWLHAHPEEWDRVQGQQEMINAYGPGGRLYDTEQGEVRPDNL